MSASGHAATPNRREMIKIAVAAGGGLLVGFSLSEPLGSDAAAQPATRPYKADGNGPFEPNAWLRIATDDSITVIVDKSEMGQGVMTALPMILAEEVEADWSRVRAEFAPAAEVYENPVYKMQLTGGSTAIRASWDNLRRAGATARELLVSAGAEAMGVPRSECHAENGSVVHAATGRRMRFGELATRAAAQRTPESVRLKEPAEYKIIGKPLARLDTAAKVAAKAVYGIDIRIPDMLVATVVHPPVFSSQVKSLDASRAKKLPGVKDVLTISSGIAVVADTYWHAAKATEALTIEWSARANDTLTSEEIRRRFAAAAGDAGRKVHSIGNAPEAFAKASRTVSATYETPYQAHATPEPMTCTAHVRDSACEVWVPTQAQTLAHVTAVALTGLPAGAVSIHTTFLGGGFGRRGDPDVVAEAVEISKAMRAPVKVIWSRSEDIQHDTYNPASLIVMKAALNEDGAPTAWSHHLVAPAHLAHLFPLYVPQNLPRWLPQFVRRAASPTVGYFVADGVLNKEATKGATPPYAIENIDVVYSRVEPGIPTGAWRSVAHSYNAFAVECFIDELAAAAGRDSLAYRRTLLVKAPRLRHALDTAAKRAGWGRTMAAGTGLGIAVHDYEGTSVAQVAEVQVSEKGVIRVPRVFCAVDCGIVINPRIVTAQIESAIAFGLTAALKSSIHIDKGRVVEGNLDDFPILRMGEMPRIEVEIVASTERPTGIGETGLPPIAPAVANAVYAATGKRVRRLPIAPQDLIRA